MNFTLTWCPHFSLFINNLGVVSGTLDKFNEIMNYGVIWYAYWLYSEIIAALIYYIVQIVRGHFEISRTWNAVNAALHWLKLSPR